MNTPIKKNSWQINTIKQRTVNVCFRNLLIVWIMFLSSGLLCQVTAQQSKVDSLLKVLQKTQSKENEVMLLHQISIEYLRSDPDQAIKYAKKGLDLADKIDLKKGQGNCLKSMGLIYDQIGKYDSAKICFEKNYAIFKELGDSIEIAKSLNNLGVIYFRNGNLEKAIEYYGKANNLYRLQKKKSLLAKGLNNIGNIYMDQAIYEKALDHYLEACRLYNEEKNESDICTTLINISNVYYRLKQYIKAKEYALETKSKSEKINDLVGVGNAFYTLSIICKDERNFEEAIIYLSEAKKIFDKIHSLYQQTLVSLTFGTTYYEQKKIKKAIENYNNTLLLAKKLGDKSLISVVYVNISAAYTENGEFKKALKYLDEATEILKELKKNDAMLSNLGNYIILYCHLSQYDKVSNYFDQYRQLSDSIYKEQSTKAIVEMQTKYETEKKDKEILTLNLDAQKRKNTIWTITSGFGFLLILSGTGFALFSNKKKREQTELHQQVTEHDIKALRAQMNPHFIFNCIHSIDRLLDDLKIQESKECLAKFSSLTRSVLENSERREISLAEDLRILSLYMDLENTRFSTPFTYSFNISSGIDQEVTLIPPLILQPFIENSIKHGFDREKGGHLKIEIQIENNSLLCVVEDNGYGRNTGKMIQSVSGYKKESMGLRLSEDRLKLISELKQVKSYFEIEDLIDSDDKPAGTRVKVILPFEQMT